MENYLFLTSEVWWMDAIISAGITAIATIICYFILYNYNLKSIQENTSQIPDMRLKLSKGQLKLSGEHKALSGEHKALSRELEFVVQNQGEIKNHVTFLRDKAVEAATWQENMSQTQLQVDEIANQIQAMLQQNLSLQQENLVLKNENENLRTKLHQLEHEPSENKSEIISDRKPPRNNDREYER